MADMGTCVGSQSGGGQGRQRMRLEIEVGAALVAEALQSGYESFEGKTETDLLSGSS